MYESQLKRHFYPEAEIRSLSYVDGTATSRRREPFLDV